MLAGHWVVTILQPGGTRFVNLITFTKDGDVEIFASYRQTMSTARGKYCRSGNSEYTLSFVQLGYNSQLVQNEMATLHSIVKVNEGGDEFIGPNDVVVTDPVTGAVLFSGHAGSVSGKLIKAEVP